MTLWTIITLLRRGSQETETQNLVAGKSCRKPALLKLRELVLRSVFKSDDHKLGLSTHLASSHCFKTGWNNILSPKNETQMELKRSQTVGDQCVEYRAPCYCCFLLSNCPNVSLKNPPLVCKSPPIHSGLGECFLDAQTFKKRTHGWKIVP